jgi:hypothetical protein
VLFISKNLLVNNDNAARLSFPIMNKVTLDCICRDDVSLQLRSCKDSILLTPLNPPKTSVISGIYYSALRDTIGSAYEEINTERRSDRGQVFSMLLLTTTSLPLFIRCDRLPQLENISEFCGMS